MSTGIQQVFATPLTSQSLTALEKLGVIRFESTGKIYKYVQYENGAAAVAGVAGEVAYYDSTAGYANSLVTSDLSDSDEVGAGVLQVSLADGEYGWVQIKGLAIMSIALTAGVVGDVLTPTGAGNGTLDVVITTVALVHICAVAGVVANKEILCDFPW